MPHPLILIDGSSYFFRAFHALPPLHTSKGLPTGAIYGVANMIKRLIKDYNPELIAVVFDAPGKTFRDEWYPQYKSHRPPIPMDLHCQFEPLKKLLEAMGLPILIMEGVEADDVIGTLAYQATALGHAVLISTGDKDFTQLVNDQITLINTMTNQTINVDAVKTKFGVAPNQMIDYLTLVGDPTDNIQGVTQCGPKTAAKWLKEYHTLSNLIANVHAITGKIGECLRACLAHLPLSQKLVTIKTDVALSTGLADLTIKKTNRSQLISLTREFEFKVWLKELLEEEEQAEPTISPFFPVTSVNYKIIRQEEELNDFIAKLLDRGSFCIHIQTIDHYSYQSELAGISIALDENEAIYIPVAHKDDALLQWSPETLLKDDALQWSPETLLRVLKPILENPHIKKIGENIKYTYRILKKYGIQLQGIVSDVTLTSYVLNSSATKHDRDSLALKYLGFKIVSLEQLCGKGAKQLPFNCISVEQAASYMVCVALTLFKLQAKLDALLTGPLKKLLEDIEIPLIPVLAEMEYTGVLIDQPTLEKHGQRLKKQSEALQKEAYALAGRVFNLNSPKQLQEILFGELKLPILTKTPSGQASTAESVLQALAFDYPLPAIILQYRSISKLISTYIDALPKCIDPQTQRIHTCYNQAVTATGRLSSSEPNLQNIPIRSEEGRLIRTAFIAPPNYLLLSADYSQIELRIMAHLSGDSNLLQAFSKGADIHSFTASEIFQVPQDQVTKEQRRRSKAINFGLIYGMSAFGLAKQLGIERQEAQNYMDSYFNRYGGVLDFMNRTRELAHQQGYVETLFGRRLYLPEINTRNLVRQRAAERMAINAPMQGSAADIIKKAMLAIYHWQTMEETYCKMIMQVHDELIFEVQEDHLETVMKHIRELMEQVTQLQVPLHVDIGVGQNWDKAH